MALTSSRIMLASRAGRNAEPTSWRLLDLDQAVDDVAARHQQAVNLLVDRIDLLAQFLQRGRGRGCVGRCLGHPENLGAGTARCGRQTGRID